MKLRSQVQQVTSMERRKGEYSLNKRIPDRYYYSRDKNVSSRRENLSYHSVRVHYGNIKYEIHHKHSFGRQQKIKRDENVLQGELRNLSLLPSMERSLRNL